MTARVRISTEEIPFPEWMLIQWYADAEKRITEWELGRNLAELVRAGCNRGHLIAALAVVGWYATLADGPQMRPRLERHRVKALIKRLQDTAAAIEELFPNPRLLSMPVPGMEPLGELAVELRSSAKYLANLRNREDLRPRSHYNRDITMAALVHYVRQKTGKFHDREVSALIAAVLDRANYTTEAHTAWRWENSALISAARTALGSNRRSRPMEPADTPKSKR